MLGRVGLSVIALSLGLFAGAAQADGVPANCLAMDVSPFTAPQSLDITGPGHDPVHFDVEVANDRPQRAQGLMCRTQMAPTHGMLFEFDKPTQQIFWMHNTLMALDIIYIAPDGHIVSIIRNARPMDDTKLPSHGLANGVLEIDAGLSTKLGLKAGDKVSHPFFVATAPAATVDAAKPTTTSKPAATLKPIATPAKPAASIKPATPAKPGTSSNAGTAAKPISSQNTASKNP